MLKAIIDQDALNEVMIHTSDCQISLPNPQIVRSGNQRKVEKKNLAIKGKLKKRIWQSKES